jgi:hypothetical protein
MGLTRLTLSHFRNVEVLGFVEREGEEKGIVFVRFDQCNPGKQKPDQATCTDVETRRENADQTPGKFRSPTFIAVAAARWYRVLMGIRLHI